MLRANGINAFSFLAHASMEACFPQESLQQPPCTHIKRVHLSLAPGPHPFLAFLRAFLLISGLLHSYSWCQCPSFPPGNNSTRMIFRLCCAIFLTHCSLPYDQQGPRTHWTSLSLRPPKLILLIRNLSLCLKGFAGRIKCPGSFRSLRYELKHHLFREACPVCPVQGHHPLSCQPLLASSQLLPFSEIISS